MSINIALKMFKIQYDTIWNKVNGKHSGKIGGQRYVRSTLQNVFANTIEQLLDWKVPFDTYDIRCLLKGYLDRQGTVQNVLREAINTEYQIM